MNILAFDTSTPILSLGLLIKEQVFLKTYTSANTHNTLLLKEINTLLQEHQLQPRDLDVLAMVNGPGSFTGLRVGSCLLKTWGYLLNIKIISLNVFEWLSYFQKSQFQLTNSDLKTAPSNPQFLLIDGNNKTFYLQIFESNLNFNPLSPILNISLTEIENDSLKKIIQRKITVSKSNNNFDINQPPTPIYSWECSEAIQQELQKQNIDLINYKRDLKNYLQLVKQQYPKNNFLNPLLFKPLYSCEEKDILK